MTRQAAAVLLASLALLSGCGDDDDDQPAGGGGGSGAAASIEQADAAVKEEDYDGAIEILEGLGDDPDAAKRLEEVKVTAARETLANARSKNLRTEPRAAMQLARTSLRYHPTPGARAFLTRATRAHEAFKRSGRDDD